MPAKIDNSQETELRNRELAPDFVSQKSTQEGFEDEFGSRLADVDQSHKDIAAREENPMNYTGGTKPQKLSLKMNIKRRGAALTIAAVLGIGGAGIGFIGTSLGPIMFIEVVTEDLNDQLAAMDIADTKVFRNKIPSSVQKRQTLEGCTQLSLRCKFATLSRTQEARLRNAGIEVIASSEYTNLAGMDRVVPDSYRFQGNVFSAEEWDNQLRTNRAAQQAQRKANNSKYRGLSDNTFSKYVLKRFGISKKAPELRGTSQERVNALLNKAGTNTASDLRFTPVDTDGNPVEADSPNRAGWTLDGDIEPHASNPQEGGTRIYTDTEHEEMNKSINRVKNARPPSKATKASVGALSVLGYWDLACSIKNIIGGAAVAAKVANQMELIQYAMGIASKVQEVKAGDASPEDATAIGDVFAQASAALTPDIASALPADSEGGVSESDLNDFSFVESEYYGKSALDSDLYKMSLNDSVVAQGTAMFSLGMGQNTLLAGVAGAAEIANAIVNVGGDDNQICGVVQNWGVRILGMVAAVAAGVGTGGGSVALQAGVAAGMIAAMMTLETILNNALDGSLIEAADLESNTVLRGDATWTGLAGIMGSAAQSRGLMAGTAEEIVGYRELSDEINQAYATIEREEANPLDIYSEYSFLGSLSRSVVRFTSTSSVFSLHTIGSLVQGGFSSMFTNTYAASTNQDRFKQCDDEAYNAINIDADVQCNIRYVMPEEDLALDVADVIDWMEGSYVEEDTLTGLPRGYTPPESDESQGAVLDFITGVSDGFVSQFIDQRAANIEDYNQYAQFLDYCAYRTMPFGETFNDNQPVNGVDAGWITGEKCMERSEMLGNFRMYTLYKSLEEDEVESSTPPASGIEQGNYTPDPETTTEWARPWPEQYKDSGCRDYPVYCGGGAHQGEDLAAPGIAGSGNGGVADILAACTGVVTRIDNNGERRTPGNWRMSNQLVINCGGGVITRYHHYYYRDVYPGITVGSRVTAGTPIAKIGNQGNTNGVTGVHLHFEVRTGATETSDGNHTDPNAWLAARGINLRL